METKKVLEHTCFQKDHPLSPIGCRCRKYVTTDEAARLITEGEAQYVIASYKSLSSEEDCPVCLNQDKLRLSCSYCRKTGKAQTNKLIPVYGADIITTVGDRGRRNISTIKKKTPRSPTIEQGHIYRALNDPGSRVSDAARTRWDEVEMLTLKERIKLLVSNFNLEVFETAWKVWEADPSKPFPLELRQEPQDNQLTGTGRRYDYGRSV